jgi:hypothetical protein
LKLDSAGLKLAIERGFLWMHESDTLVMFTQAGSPGAAAGAIRAVEDLLSVGYAEDSIAIFHQLTLFQAFERGLLAAWETPEELVCVPVCLVA